MAAKSFCFPITSETSSREALAQRLAQQRAEVRRPTGALLFTSRASDDRAFVEAARTAMRGLPTCIVPAAGVLSERGEIEGAPGAAGLLFEGGVVKAFAASGEPEAIREALEETGVASPSVVLVFARSAPSLEALEAIRGAAPSATILGGGTQGMPAIAYAGEGIATSGAIAGLVMGKIARPIVAWSPACKLHGELEPIRVTPAGLVETVGGEPALDRLTAASRARDPNASAAPPLVLAALANAEGERPLLRPIRGVDPSRRAVLIGPEAKPGMRLAFATRDAASARAGLDEAARDLLRQASGSAPLFAIHMTCAGRGQALYGAADVEARILRQRFGDLPIAGMHSSFEIVPWAPGEARVALYTAAIALFRAPS